MNVQRISGFFNLVRILKNNEKYQTNCRIQTWFDNHKFFNNSFALTLSRILSEDIGATGATKTALMISQLNLLNTPVDSRMIMDVVMEHEKHEKFNSRNAGFGYNLSSENGENPILTECFYILASISGLLFHKNEKSNEDLIAYSDIELYSLINKLSMLHEEHLPLFAEYQIHILFQDIISENESTIILHPRSERLLKNLVNL